MKKGIYLTFDVGGTSIKAGVVDGSGEVLTHTLSQYESKANGTATEIIDHFIHMAVDLLDKADIDKQQRIAGIGYAFPGPFDYEQGISYIQGLDKFEGLYGLRFGDLLRKGIEENGQIAARMDRESILRFENDAALFALGEAYFGQAATFRKAVCFTLGTGVGSGFMESGHLIKQREDIPANGWVYHLPYRSGIADDYISRRGLLELARDFGLNRSGQDVKELADAARRGEEAALQLFNAFGRQMGEALASALKTFAPDIIVLGGQISKSGELFVPSFSRELSHRGVITSVAISTDSLRSTLLGIYQMLQAHRG
ncbi:ROK family protein [Paenibacillus aestuarii]|uniref:ROK family protein n=1 Tax=Paenibacillus aestuarii TaxID=516965 RepID=A0ABW0KHX0_9BACL|nr:ROK family protein [Paenibacillus aestuarii]